MKSIEIKTEMKIPFLKACQFAGLEVQELKKIKYPERSYFRVTKTNISQDDIFKLGVYFSGFVLRKG